MFFLLSTLHIHIPGIGMFKYISFRAIAALLTSALVVFLFGKRFISSLKKWQAEGQPIRKDGPQEHLKKSGTPTMGGLMVLLGIFVSCFLWGNFQNFYVWLSLITTFVFGLVGFYDDYLKLKNRSSDGLSGKLRLIVEFCIAMIICYHITKFTSTSIVIPFVKSYLINLGWMFLPFSAFVVVGTSNAVNFTDGLDGLAIVPVMIAACSFAFIAYLCGNMIFANYLQIPFVPGTGELSVVLASLIGAGLGFLWFNAPPAAMFMGDTGSLAMGALLGLVAVATKQEIVLVLVGGIFVMEALSVIIQVVSYKMRKKRVFLMAPIHHHYEKKGWSESQVVIRFWIIAVFLALLGLLTFKIR